MKPINIIIMDNLMGEHTGWIHRIYDLKGSTFNRITKDPEHNKTTRKDLNFLEEQ
jgi:hypothetical protein